MRGSKIERSGLGSKISFKRILRYWWVIVLTTASALFMGWYLTTRQVPSYRASATVVIVPSAKITNNREITEVYNTLDRRSVVATLAKMPLSKAVNDAVAQEIPDARNYEITSVVIPDTNILEISASGSDAQTAQAVVNASVQHAAVLAGQLLDTFQLKSVDPATTARMTSPDPVRNYAAATLLGLGIGLALAFLASLLSPLFTDDGASADIVPSNAISRETHSKLSV